MKKKTPGLITLLVLTTIVVVMWIIFNIYRTLNTVPPIEVPEKISKQIDPKIDEKTVTEIKGRLFFK